MNGCEVYFSATLSLVSRLSDRKVPNDFGITCTVPLQCPISAEIRAVDSQSDLRILNFDDKYGVRIPYLEKDHHSIFSTNHGANKAPDARLDIHARGFWER